MSPNPSIERTSSSKLRLLPAAAHVERWAPGGEVRLIRCTVGSAGVRSVMQRSGMASSIQRASSSSAPRFLERAVRPLAASSPSSRRSRQTCRASLTHFSQGVRAAVQRVTCS